MKPKIKRFFRITANLFLAILLILLFAVNTVDELYEFVSDDSDVRSTLYAAGAEDMVLIKSATAEDGEGILKAPTRLVNTYRVVEYISWYMESGSEGCYSRLSEELTENDMLYIDRLASLRHAGRVAQQLMYTFLACYILCIFGVIVYSGIATFIKSRKSTSADNDKPAEDTPRKFDPATLLPPLMIGIPYLLLIIITTYFPEAITDCLAKLLQMDTLPALTQGDVLHAIFTPDILHSFIREMFLSFKDDIVWLFIIALIPMVREFIKKKFPFLSLEETLETDSEVDDH